MLEEWDTGFMHQMFAQTRDRLAKFYSWVLGLLLLLFGGTIFFVSALSLERTLEYDLQTVAQQIVTEQRQALTGTHLPLTSAPHDSGDLSRHLFYYTLDMQDRLVASYEPVSQLRVPVRSLIQTFQGPHDTVFKRSLSLADGTRAAIQLTVLDVIDQNNQTKKLGTVYLGQDITPYDRMLKSLLIWLLALCALFVLLASAIAYYMASRTMVPIERSFAWQQEFTSNASHELRTPLSILLASLELVMGDPNSTFSPESAQVLEDMKDEAKKMSYSRRSHYHS